MNNEDILFYFHRLHCNALSLFFSPLPSPLSLSLPFLFLRYDALNSSVAYFTVIAGVMYYHIVAKC